MKSLIPWSKRMEKQPPTLGRNQFPDLFMCWIKLNFWKLCSTAAMKFTSFSKAKYQLDNIDKNKHGSSLKVLKQILFELFLNDMKWISPSLSRISFNVFDSNIGTVSQIGFRPSLLFSLYRLSHIAILTRLNA